MRIVPSRGAAVVVLLAGLVIGTVWDAPPVRRPVQAGGYQVLSGDFHVHGFPGDGALSFWSLRDEARFAGLDVFGLTNHNQVLAGQLGRWMSGVSDGPIVLVGQEITNPTYHMIGLGLSRTVRWDQPAAGAIADVHAQGGVAIAAHPVPVFHGWDDEALASVDGTEIAHPIVKDNPPAHAHLLAFHERARRVNPDVAPFGSSDMHNTATLASYRTYVFVGERSAAGVLEAIRSGRTVAEDHAGRLYGRTDLVTLLGRQRPQGRTDPHPTARRVAVSVVVLGLLGVLFLGRAQGGAPRK